MDCSRHLEANGGVFSYPAGIERKPPMPSIKGVPFIALQIYFNVCIRTIENNQVIFSVPFHFWV